MPHRREATEKLVVVEERLYQLEVVQMCAAIIWIIEYPDVTGLQPVALFIGCLDRGTYCKRHGSHEHGQTGFTLNEGVARCRIVQAVRCVMRFRDNRIECTAIQRGIHFVCNLFQASLEYSQSYRVH